MVHAQAALVNAVCGWRDGMRVVMCYAPFVPFALKDGLTVILPRMDFSRPASANPHRIAEAVTAHRAEYAFASPIVWLNLVRHGERTRVRLPTLRHAIAAGAPVPARLHTRLTAMLHPEGRLHTPYGATEAMPLTTTDTEALAETWAASRNGYGTCVGHPLPGIQLQVIRVTDDPIATWSEDLPVSSGTIGEIVVAGDVVSPAYPERPEETARAKIHCGNQVLHRTGDLGRMDAEGLVWFCGRKSHRIETEGGMLATVALENIYNEHPAVFRTALVGVGPARAQTPVACVELESGVRFSRRLEADLVGLADGTPFRGVVTRFLPHRGLPVDARHNSKIRREELVGWASSRLGHRVRSA
jgi:acyl-CoA synthetase (AMP-forming)/AMP-acid ligase II